MVKVGLEILLGDQSRTYKGKRLGYLSNQASTTCNLVQGRTLLQEKYGQRLTCLFSPQHGFFSEKQDNMIESDHLVDEVTGLVVYSLYGEHRQPTEEMFDGLDILLIDLVDVGTRVYTFMHTMAYCLTAAQKFARKVVVLDRPNPLGGENIEGNILRESCSSFVGLYPLPMRHGLSLGELALYINSEFAIGADLEVIPMAGWKRKHLLRETGLPWVAPSPNMPTPDTALVYPGQVLWEGTNVSEGRGTTQPFEFVGAPYWRHEELLERLTKTALPGCFLRPVVFQPTSGKWAEEPCYGFQLHVTDSESFLPYRTSLALLQAVILQYPDEFRYKQPPYEYEFERLPMDLILGDSSLRAGLESGRPVMELEREWQEELALYDKKRQRYFLYR
ncbi:MAG: exo-beta-N-acetylmuramidase NamZ family protein [Desulforhopalus sp.]